MTYRPIFRDDGERPERRTTPDFSKFKVHDSYHKPVMDNLPPGDPADSKRLSRRWLEELDMRLSDRDKQVLASVRKYRYLMTGQIYRLHFTDVSKQAAFFILQKLRELHLLNTLSRRRCAGGIGFAGLVPHPCRGTAAAASRRRGRCLPPVLRAVAILPRPHAGRGGSRHPAL